MGRIDRQHFVLAFLVVLIFLGLRFWNYQNRLNFSMDQGIFMSRAADIWARKDLTLIGPEASPTVNGRHFFQGPAIYYLLMIIGLISNWDPILTSVIFTLLGLVGVWCFFLATREVTNEVSALLGTAVYVSLPVVVKYSNFIWNPNFLLTLTPILLLIWVKFKGQKGMVLSGLLSGVGLQFHFQFAIVICILVFDLIRKRKQLLIWYVLGLVIGYLPLIVFDTRNNLYNLKTVWEWVLTGNREQIIYPYYFLSFISLALLFAVKYLNIKLIRVLAIATIFYSSSLVVSEKQTDLMPKNWTFDDLKKTVNIINTNGQNFNIVNLVDGNSQFDAARFWLRDRVLATDQYGVAEELWVVSSKNEDELLKYKLWEIDQFKPTRIEQIVSINGKVNLYKMTKDFRESISAKVTVVNPVRSRELWADNNIGHFVDQYKIVEENEVAGTWLIQGDVLEDGELVNELKKIDKGQEVGILLEVSKNLAEKAGVIYPSQTYWYNPRAVFLSGYSQKERRRLIDRIWGNFKKVFGYWPKSVGGWWIDSYSLNYIKNKYDLETAMIVADQKTTDGYGVWGQWVGVPYVADKDNVLLPTLDKERGENITVIQWAQRDLNLGYLGEGPNFSNYSVQANDYLEQGKNIDYFKEISKYYLNNGQLAIGLEVGQEAVGNLEELEKQIKYLKSAGVEFVTMGQFGSDFAAKWTGRETKIGDWKLTADGRENSSLGQKINYNRGVAFSDYWVADKSDFLERNLEKLDNKSKTYLPIWALALGITTVVAVVRKWKWWLLGTPIILNSFGLLFKSKYELGWEVFYGSEVKSLMLVQVLVLLAGAVLVYKFKKIGKWWLAGFGLIPIVSAINYSVIGGEKFLGVILGLKFFGLRFGDGIVAVGEKMQGVIIGSFLKFPWDKVWENPLLGLGVYPLMMLGLGMILSWLSNKINKRWAGLIWWGLVVLIVINLWQIIISDPRTVVAIK